MKKILATFLISSLLSANSAFAFSVFKKNKAENTEINVETESKDTVEIEAPEEKNQEVSNESTEKIKTDKKIRTKKEKNTEKEPKNTKKSAKSRKKPPKELQNEAETMYETKFPAINSTITYSEMNGEVTLADCIKLAITHHPSIMSALSNAEIYKTRIGQAWSNYFPTIGAGVSYSKNDTLMTSKNAYSSMMSQKYGMYYMPTLSANLLLFDFGKTKADADSAKRRIFKT